MQKEEKYICPECSDAPVIHRLSKWTLAFDAFLCGLYKPFERVFNRFTPSLYSFFDFLLPPLFWILAKLHIGKLLREPLESDTMRTKTMWQAAEKRGIALYQFSLFGRPLNTFVASFNGSTIVFEGLPRPKGFLSDSFGWMDDKSKIKEVFLKTGIPTSRGGSFFSFTKALAAFQGLRKPVIAKPSVGSRSRHTTIHINTEEELDKAFRSAKRLSPWVIIEEELKGPVFRISLIGGEVAGILRRDPPKVFGDGKKTVEELIQEENMNPKRKGIFHEVPIDDFVISELAHQKLLLESVPEKGREVILHPKVGRSQGGTNTNVIKEAHPENIELFRRIGEVLADPLIGIDFIIEDMGKSWKEQELSGVIECNAIPFLDLHHFPYMGEPVDAMGMLWDIVFTKSGPVKNSSISS